MFSEIFYIFRCIHIIQPFIIQPLITQPFIIQPFTIQPFIIQPLIIQPLIISASPQIASSSAGDCAFEDDVCGWTNPGRNDGLDELNWERLEARGEPRYPQVNLIYCALG